MYSDEELALIWFDYNDVSFSKAEKILKKFNKIDDIFDKNLVKNAVFEEPFELVKQNLLKIDINLFKAEIEAEHQKLNITAVTFCSKNFPQKLKVISDPPLVIYTRGDISLLSKKSITIVGTRKPSDYGKIVCEKFTKQLSNAGLVTVSGLAYGVDTIVAQTTLAAGGKTIAVMGGGLDSIYPAQNKQLASEICKNGLLVSEYRPKIKPQNYFFVSRNRIVSALSLGTLVVEAGEKSGTISTANYALEQGKELFVVPGNITSPQSAGTNRLIDEIPDTFTISPDSILSRLHIEKREKPQVSSQLQFEDDSVIRCLKDGEKSFDELVELTSLPPAELSSKLITMEISGIIKKGSGNTYFLL